MQNKKRMKYIVCLILFFFSFSNIFVNFANVVELQNIESFATLSIGENLLLNPGFEQEGLAGWTNTGTSGVASRIGGSSGYNYKSDSYSLRHLLSASYETFTYQTVTGLEDGIYAASAWVRRPNTATSHEIAQMEITVGNGAIGGGNIPNYQKNISTTTLPTFNQIIINNIVVENGVGQATICFHSKTPAAGPVLYIDDVEFKLVEGITTLYTVSFDTSSGSAIEATQVASGNTIQKPTDPVKSGYTFEGWYTEDTLTNAYNFSTPVNTNITLYAKWAEISIDPENFVQNPGFEEATITNWTTVNKGSGSIEKANGVQNISYNTGSYSIKHQSSGTHEAKSSQIVTNLQQGLYTASAYVRMPTPFFDTSRMSVTTGVYSTDPQYSVNITQSAIFVQYSIPGILVIDGTLTLNFESKTSVSGQVMYIDDVELKLDQEVSDYNTVSFNTDGGSNVAARYVVDTKKINPPTSPKKTGFIFEGWYTDNVLANAFDFLSPINSDITLYAKWTPIPIDPDNFIENSRFEKGTTEGWKVTSNLPYTATISEGTEKLDYNSGTAALKLSQTKRYEAWVTQTVEGMEKGYYTAKAWVKRPVAVRSDDVYRMQVKDHGNVIRTVDIPGSAQFFEVAIEDILVTTGKCTVEFYVKTFDNHILYIDDVELKKTATPYTALVANFDSMGGSKVYNVVADSDNKIAPPAAPTKTGYTFAGWYTDNSFIQAFDFSQSVSDDIILSAKWINNAIPMIGNIRWDVLTGYAPFDELNSLSKEKYNYRAPFFTSIDENYEVTGNNNSIATMEQEIDYAVEGGIDYWAFTTGPELGKNNPEYYALDKFLSTDKRHEIGFSIILHRYDNTPWENRVDMLVKWMQEANYVQVMDNRPLVYIYRVSELEAKYGVGSGTQAAIDLIRSKAQAAGLANPYIVAMASSTQESIAQNKEYIEKYGLDAISAYGYAGERNESNLSSNAPYSQLATQNIASWDNYKATGKKMIPLVALGRNEEPRKDTSVVYGGGHGPYFDNPTATEAAIQVKAGLEYVRNNGNVCESNAILSYAWNEFAEGGWICPTLSEGTSKLDAISQMKLAYAQWISENSNKPETLPADNDTQVPETGNSTTVEVKSILTKIIDLEGEVTLNLKELSNLKTLIIKNGSTLELNEKILKELNIKENITVAIKASITPLINKTLTIIGNKPVYDLTITVDGKPVENFGNAKIKVSIPYQRAENEKVNAIIVYYINSDGVAKPVKSNYNATTNSVEFKTNHFSKFAVGYNEVNFLDVTDEWFSDAVTFISARGITQGIAANKFGPNVIVTRGQFITMLCRAYGIEESTGDNFSDSGNAYYTGYIAAAKQLKISNGVGNDKFAPERKITREEMFTLLYKAFDVFEELTIVEGSDFSTFIDTQDISPWALEAVKYFVENGVVKGNDGKLAPRDKASRAEMAQILYNILK